MSDIVVTNRNNRHFYCDQGWYKHKTRNKWARITVDKVKVNWFDNDYVYDYQVGDNVRSLAKDHWERKVQQDVPMPVYNRLEALV
jgi:hypothetical protein